MATEIQGAEIQLLLREFGSTDEWQEVVCEETVTMDVTNDVTTTKTKCGVFKGIDVADFKLNGTGVANIDPTSAEVSHDGLLTWQLARTKLEFWLQNRAYGSNAAGTVVKMSGGAYINATQFQGNNNDVVKFTWSLEGVGTLNDDES